MAKKDKSGEETAATGAEGAEAAAGAGGEDVTLKTNADNVGQTKLHTYERTNASGGYETTEFPQSSHHAAKAAGWKRVDGVDDDADEADETKESGT